MRRRRREHRCCSVWRANEQVLKESGRGQVLRHVQHAGGHQLSGEPVEALVEPHAAAGVAALYVPAPPAAQLVQAQQLRHLLHRHGAGDVLQSKESVWPLGLSNMCTAQLPSSLLHSNSTDLFVGEDEQQGVAKLLLRQQFGQLAVSLHQTVPVAAVHHKHHRCRKKGGVGIY